MKTKFIIFLLIILFYSDSVVYAQKKGLPDFDNLLKSHSEADSTRVNLLNSLSERFINNDLEKAKQFAAEALNTSENINYSKGKTEALFLLGLVNYYRRDYNSALEFFQKSLLLNEKYSNKNGLAKNWNFIGNIYFQKGNFPLSLEYYQKAKNLAIEVKDSIRIANCLNDIGHLYSTQSNYYEAIRYYREALIISENLNDKDGLSYCLINIGNFYKNQSNYQLSLEYFKKALTLVEDLDDLKGISKILLSIGNIHYELNDYDQAIINFKKALNIVEQLKDKKAVGRSLNSLGEAYKKQRKFTEALQYSEKALKIRREIKDNDGVAFCYENIGDIYYDLGDYNKSLQYFEKLLEIAKQLDNNSFIYSSYFNIGKVYLITQKYQFALKYTLKSLEIGVSLNELNNLKKVHQQLAMVYEKLQNYKKAYEHHVLFKQLEDNTLNKDNIKKLIVYELNYEFEKEKKASELEQLKKDLIQQEETNRQKIISYSFLIGFLLTLSLSIVIFRTYTQKRKANNILEKQKIDIEQKNAELLELNATKNIFFSIIAHDLRGPLGGFWGLTQIMADEISSLSMFQIQDYAESMKSSASNIYRLLENLLQWAQIQQGLVPFEPVLFPLLPVLNESLALARESAKNKDIDIVIDISGDLMVFADSNILQTVIRNLASNAVKFTPKGGKIWVNASNIDNLRVEIAIKDTGIGMNQKIRDRLFRLDTQINRKGTEGETSTGLGLLLCRGLIEKHKGKMWVESEEGLGSIFYFTLPLIY